jgi:hypothetical protein
MVPKMKKTHEEYHCFELTKFVNEDQFRDFNAWDSHLELMEPKIEFSILEFKSKEPLTDCCIKYHYRVDNWSIEDIGIHLINYRKDIAFQNEHYSIEVSKILEINSDEYRPYSFSFVNNRDSECTAKLFFKLIYPEWPRPRQR